MKRTITKSLAGAEDLLVGRIDKVKQTRNGQEYDISGIDIPVVVLNTDAVSALDISQVTRARVYTTANNYDDYIYDKAATEGLPSTGIGFWVKRTQTEATEDTQGPVRFATEDEAKTGTNTTKALTPAGAKAHIDSRLHKEIVAGPILAVSGTADAIVLSTVNMPAALEYTVGARYRVIPSADNTTASVTVNLDGLGLASVSNISLAGQLKAGAEYTMEITSTNTVTMLLGGSGGSGATGGGTDQLFYESDLEMTADYTVSGKNAMMAGPLKVQAGVTLTVDTGSRLVVV